jgi:hypothetical protein
VVEDVYVVAPDGPMLAEVPVDGRWPWIIVALCAAVIAIAGLLFSPGGHHRPAVSSAQISSWNSQLSQELLG